jgi:hypothetical protein
MWEKKHGFDKTGEEEGERGQKKMRQYLNTGNCGGGMG